MATKNVTLVFRDIEADEPYIPQIYPSCGLSNVMAQGVHLVAELHGARVVMAKRRYLGEALSEDASGLVHREAPTSDSETDADSFAMVSVKNVSQAVFDTGHLADIIFVSRDLLAGLEGRLRADEIVHLIWQAPRPVWLVRESFRYPGHIVVGYDAGVHAGHGCESGETLGSRLTVLHVSETRDADTQQEVLEWAAGCYKPYNVTMECIWSFGNAAITIRSFCQSNASDLAVVGAGGLSCLRGLLFGSAASQLIEDSPFSA